MKLAITSANGAIDGGFDPHFGRAAYFCIIETEVDTFELVANPALNSPSGAGVSAAQLMGEYAVTTVVSGSFGPKAFKALSAARIQMYAVQTSDNLTVADVLAKMKAGQLKPISAPSHNGSHGKGKH